jgi:hypothetical protein
MSEPVSVGSGIARLKDFDNDSSNRFFQASAGKRRHCTIPKNLHNLKPLRLSSLKM